MVNTMARRTDGGVRFRPVGSQRSRTAPVYSPRGTGCPAIEQAVQGLYKGQNEESFWTLMSALNYALELETHVLVPLQTALSAQGAPAPWMEHPIPAEKADGLALWTLRNDKGRCWLPLFTSVAAAGADRSTGSRPMADRTLEQAMQLALDTPGIDGVVLDPWSHSATLDGALLNGLLHAGHTPETPGDEEADAGKEAARNGNWEQAAECFEKAAELGSAIDRASLIAREGKSNLVCFKLDGETLEVSSNSETGDMEEKMQVITEGKDLTIAFNVRYITDVLKALSDDQIVMRFNSNVSPCVVCPVEGDSYLYLVLPVRVFNA